MENLYTIGKIFSDRIFRVPDYQRGYAWEQRQCQDFVEDLDLLNEDQEHFFGLLHRTLNTPILRLKSNFRFQMPLRL